MNCIQIQTPICASFAHAQTASTSLGGIVYFSRRFRSLTTIAYVILINSNWKMAAKNSEFPSEPKKKTN